MKGQAAAYKEKLQEATAGQAQAVRLAADLEVEQTLHKEAKSHLATLESRYTLLTLLWAARFTTRFLIKLTPKGVVFCFLSFSC